MNDILSRFCFCRLPKIGKFSYYKHCVVVILAFCILLEEAAIANNAKHRRSSRLNYDGEDLLEESADKFFVQKGEENLRLGRNLHEYNDNFVRKRVIRAPPDDDIDEAEDSDEEAETNEGRHKSKRMSSLAYPQPGDNLSVTGIPPKPATSGNKTTYLSSTTSNSTLPSSSPGRATPPEVSPPGLTGNHISTPPKQGQLDLPANYSNLVIPKLDAGKLNGGKATNSTSPVPVSILLSILEVRDIDEKSETLTLDIDITIEWVDDFTSADKNETARESSIILNPIVLKHIWVPDIYIDEVVTVKRTSLMNKPLKLEFSHLANGYEKISYTTRLTVQLTCEMYFTYYPADTHTCTFAFESYSYFGEFYSMKEGEYCCFAETIVPLWQKYDTDLKLSWIGTGVYLKDPKDPNFYLQVESINTTKDDYKYGKITNDKYDALKFTILARRKLSFHMVQTYLPSTFFIVITWLCFLVPARLIEVRIGISMTTLLTLTAMFSAVRESTPVASYVKAIDIWMVFCICFVFLTLLEFATLVCLRTRREDAVEKGVQEQGKAQERRGNGHKELELSPSIESVELRKHERIAEFTEKYAFLIFSIMFVLFNIAYWSWLLVASEYLDWKVNSTLNADVNKILD